MKYHMTDPDGKDLPRQMQSVVYAGSFGHAKEIFENQTKWGFRVVDKHHFWDWKITDEVGKVYHLEVVYIHDPQYEPARWL